MHITNKNTHEEIPLSIDKVTPQRSVIDLSALPKNSFDSVFYGFKLKTVLDDVIVAEFQDESKDGTAIQRRGLYVPINTDTKAWRIGKAILVGPLVKSVKVGDYIIFPNNLGQIVSNIEIDQFGTLDKALFINEQRIFGICNRTDSNESVAAILTTNSQK